MDWPLLITDLEKSGLTQQEIAGKSGCTQPYVSQLKSGRRKRPDYQRGQALVDLHKKLCKPRKELRAA